MATEKNSMEIVTNDQVVHQLSALLDSLKNIVENSNVQKENENSKCQQETEKVKETKQKKRKYNENKQKDKYIALLEEIIGGQLEI